LNIGILCPDFNWHFIEPYLADWSHGFADITQFQPRKEDGAFPRRDLQSFMNAVDVVWVEWGLAHLVTLTHLPNCKPVIVHFHRYDAYLPHHEYVNWQNVKQIIFVGKHIQDDFANLHKVNVPMKTINLGIDTALFTSGTKTYGTIAGTVATMTPNKGLAEMFQITKQLGWKLILRAGGGQGAAVDYNYQRAIQEAVTKNPHTKIVPPIDHEDMPTFYAGLDVYLNFSTIESFSMSICEAMACGCFPIIKSWIGARDLWPEKCIVENVGQAIRKLRWWTTLTDNEKSDLSRECRDWVIAKYNIQDKFKEIRSAIEEVMK